MKARGQPVLELQGGNRGDIDVSEETVLLKPSPQKTHWFGKEPTIIGEEVIPQFLSDRKQQENNGNGAEKDNQYGGEQGFEWGRSRINGDRKPSTRKKEEKTKPSKGGSFAYVLNVPPISEKAKVEKEGKEEEGGEDKRGKPDFSNRRLLGSNLGLSRSADFVEENEHDSADLMRSRRDDDSRPSDGDDGDEPRGARENNGGDDGAGVGIGIGGVDGGRGGIGGDITQRVNLKHGSVWDTGEPDSPEEDARGGDGDDGGDDDEPGGAEEDSDVDDPKVERRRKRVKRGRINPDNPIPPPMCPPRLVDLLEEALHVDAKRPITPREIAKSSRSAGQSRRQMKRTEDGGSSTSSSSSIRGSSTTKAGHWSGNEEKFWWSAVTLAENGAPAAVQRSRSRAEEGGAGGNLWQPAGHLPTWLGGVGGGGAGGGRGWGRDGDNNAVATPRSLVAQQALGSGFKAIAAYRAHDTKGGLKGALERGGNGDDSDDRLPVRLTGFTWDGVTVVAKETVAGCARVADSRLANQKTPSRTVPPRKEAQGSTPPVQKGDGGEHSWEDVVDVSGGGAEGGNGGSSRRMCLEVEEAFVPSAETVVDIIVPVRWFDMGWRGVMWCSVVVFK